MNTQTHTDTLWLLAKQKTHCLIFRQWQRSTRMTVLIRLQLMIFSFSYVLAPDPDITNTVVSEEKPDYVL